MTVSGTVTGTLTTSAGASTATGAFELGGSVSGSGACNVLGVSFDATTDTVGIITQSAIGGSGKSSQCTYPDLGFTGSPTLKVDNPWPAANGSSGQLVAITLESPKPASQSPKSVTFTLENSSGGTISSNTVNGATNNGLDPSDNIGQDISYSKTYTLNPGTYKICFNAVETGCQQLTIGTTLKSYVFGNFPDGGDINVVINDTLYSASGSPTTVSPYEVTLSQNGKTVYTTYTNDNNQSGDPGTDSSGSVTQSKITLDGTFKNVKSGIYQACLPGASDSTCVRVDDTHSPTPNPVVFNITSDPEGLAGQYTCQQPGATTSCPDTKTCESSGFTLNWVFCGLYDGISGASSWILDNLINPELRTNPICLNSTGTGCIGGKQADITFTVWSNFRIYGDIFLVVVLLVVVFGEALGGGVIEAYTLKKVLPRLLAAAILINLSIYLVAFLVDITNIVGGGIGELITEPLKHAGAFHITPSGIQGKELGGASIIGLVAGGTALVSLFNLDGGALILLGIVLPAFLAFIAILFTILIRKAIITILIYVSPIAFALWCLPNTEKYFKKWWDTLFEMLIIYPIIVLLFAVCDVLSVTAENTGSSNNVLSFIISFLFLVIPLILIPYAFKLAGNSLGQIHAGVTGARQRANGMMKGRRDRARQKFGERRTTNQAKLWNSGAAGALGKLPGGRYAVGRRRESIDQKARMLVADFGKDPRAQAIAHDDEALRAATYSNYGDAISGMTARNIANGDNQQDARAKAQRAARAVQASTGFGRAQSIWASQQMAQTGTAFDNIQDVAQTIARASGGNASTNAALAGNINSTTKQVGRHDLAPGYAALNDLSTAEGLAARGGGPAPTQAQYGSAVESAWRSGSLYQHANDKPQNLRNSVAHYERLLRSTDPVTQQQDREKAAVFFSELKTMSPNASGEVSGIIQQTLDNNSNAIGMATASLPDTDSRRGVDRAIMGERARFDAPTGATVREQVQVGVKPETAGQRIERMSRSYERPDQNNM